MRLAAGAGALAALVALSAVAMVAAAPAPGGGETRPVRSETSVIRVVAAAVAAAAREFSGADQQMDATAAAPIHVAAVDPTRSRPPARAAAGAADSTQFLGERVLDLPPPAC